MGPLLVTLYTTPLSLVINRHHLSHHLYADDTQIYISLSTSDASSSLQQIRTCIDDIFCWMTESRLKLNADKTEFLIIGTHRQRDKIKTLFPIPLLNQHVMPAVSTRNLGVIFDDK